MRIKSDVEFVKKECMSDAAPEALVNTANLVGRLGCSTKDNMC